MRNILHELYYGNLRPGEGVLQEEPEYREAANQAYSILSAFLENLDDDSRKLYNQVEIAISARDSIEYAYVYIDGFRTGARIMLACMSQKEA